MASQEVRTRVTRRLRMTPILSGQVQDDRSFDRTGEVPVNTGDTPYARQVSPGSGRLVLADLSSEALCRLDRLQAGVVASLAFSVVLDMFLAGVDAGLHHCDGLSRQGRRELRVQVRELEHRTAHHLGVQRCPQARAQRLVTLGEQLLAVRNAGLGSPHAFLVRSDEGSKLGWRGGCSHHRSVVVLVGRSLRLSQQGLRWVRRGFCRLGVRRADRTSRCRTTQTTEPNQQSATVHRIPPVAAILRRRPGGRKATRRIVKAGPLAGIELCFRAGATAS